MEAVFVALIVAMASVIGQALMSILASRQRREEKREDWARQEEVARQAATAAQLLLDANERVASQSSASSKAISGQLGQIHDLVNSNLDRALRGELTALAQQAIMSRELIAMNRQKGREPSPGVEDALKETDRRVAELRIELDDRGRSTEIAEAKLEESK